MVSSAYIESQSTPGPDETSKKKISVNDSRPLTLSVVFSISIPSRSGISFKNTFTVLLLLELLLAPKIRDCQLIVTLRLLGSSHLKRFSSVHCFFFRLQRWLRKLLLVSTFSVLISCFCNFSMNCDNFSGFTNAEDHRLSIDERRRKLEVFPPDIFVYFSSSICMKRFCFITNSAYSYRFSDIFMSVYLE